MCQPLSPTWLLVAAGPENDAVLRTEYGVLVLLGLVRVACACGPEPTVAIHRLGIQCIF